MPIYLAIARGVARWFAMSVMAWLFRQVFDACVRPFFAKFLASVQARSERAAAALGVA